MARDEEHIEHPAMRNFNEPLEYVKHVLGKALKWAAIGALIGGAIIGLPALLGGAAVGWIPTVGTWLIGAGKGAAITGAVAVASITGTIGAMLGLSSAGEAVEDQKLEAMHRYDQNEARRLRVANVESTLAQRQQQINTQMGQLRQAGLPGMSAADLVPMQPAGAHRR